MTEEEQICLDLLRVLRDSTQERIRSFGFGLLFDALRWNLLSLTPNGIEALIQGLDQVQKEGPFDKKEFWKLRCSLEETGLLLVPDPDSKNKA